MSKIFKVLLSLVISVSAGNTMYSHTISDLPQMYNQNNSHYYNDYIIKDRRSWFNCGGKGIFASKSNDFDKAFNNLFKFDKDFNFNCSGDEDKDNPYDINLYFNKNVNNNIDNSQNAVTIIKTEHTPVNNLILKPKSYKYPFKINFNGNNEVNNNKSEVKLDNNLLDKKRARDKRNDNNVAIKDKMNKKNKSNSKDILYNKKPLDIKTSDNKIIFPKNELLGNNVYPKLKGSNNEQYFDSIVHGIDSEDTKEIATMAQYNIDLQKSLVGLQIDKQIDTVCKHYKYSAQQVKQIKEKINNFLETDYLKKDNRMRYVQYAFDGMICQIMKIENPNNRNQYDKYLKLTPRFQELQESFQFIYEHVLENFYSISFYIELTKEEFEHAIKPLAEIFSKAQRGTKEYQKARYKIDMTILNHYRYLNLKGDDKRIPNFQLYKQPEVRDFIKKYKDKYIYGINI